MKTKLIKAFTREFPLIHVQMWGRRYTSEFFGEQLAHIPIYVFYLKDGLVTAYRNPTGQAGIVNPIIRAKLDNDPDYIKKFVDQKSEVLKRLIKINEASEVSFEEFKSYLKDLFDYWQIHYISQFLPLDEERFTKEERDYALALRKTIDQVIHNSWNSITPIIKKLYPDSGHLVAYVGWDELFDSKIPDISELKKREVEGVLVYNGDIVSESELNEWEKKDDFEVEWDNMVVEEKEITGQVACSGKVTGSVKILLKKDDMVNFREGEVLVSYMTMPAFMPAMQKAAAFVTDEGGITCHAAIVARELKKPCIIGTRIATKVLKDGDLVEVDAENGIVRILK